MAFRKLVEGDCGGANSLVDLTSHFVQDRALKDEGFHGFGQADIASSSSEQLVQEFLEETMGHNQQQPFRMDSLLAEIRELEGRGITGPVQSPSVSQLTREEDVRAWAQQYIAAGKHFEENAEPGIWTTPFGNRDGADLDLGLGPGWAEDYLQRTQDSSSEETPVLADLSNSEEYVDFGEDSREIAAEIINSSKDNDEFANSKFMKFMQRIKDGELALNIEDGLGSEETQREKAKHWALDYNKGQGLSAAWEAEANSASSETEAAAGKMKRDFEDMLWEKLSHQWDDLSGSLSSDEAWGSEFADFSSTFKDYKFSTDNPHEDLTDPLQEGRKKLELGDLAGAVLCFEAAVRKEPENPLAWQLLGTTQAENEQDPQALAALKKCVQLEPNNLDALMALAVSYTNESYQNQACRALKEWLHMNPKYSDLVPPDAQDANVVLGISSIMTRELHESTKNLYLQAARRNPTDIDPDVQCGLGVLFNLSEETDFAVDCFKTALQARPNDSKLWNRLGATLANGSRSEEAVDAYRSALQISPGFIRARYNLALSCARLGAHREAAEHLLAALNLQASGLGPQGENVTQMSDSIWNTLRLVVSSFMDRSDLVDSLNSRDLKKLSEEFGVD